MIKSGPHTLNGRTPYILMKICSYVFADFGKVGDIVCTTKTTDNDHYLCKLSTGDSLMPRCETTICRQAVSLETTLGGWVSDLVPQEETLIKIKIKK